MSDTFGSILQYLRKRAGLSQAQLAKNLNVTPATIGLYEQNRRQPPPVGSLDPYLSFRISRFR